MVILSPSGIEKKYFFEVNYELRFHTPRLLQNLYVPRIIKSDLFIIGFEKVSETGFYESKE